MSFSFCFGFILFRYSHRGVKFTFFEFYMKKSLNFFQFHFHIHFFNSRIKRKKNLFFKCVFIKKEQKTNPAAPLTVLLWFCRVLLTQTTHNHLPICRWTRKKSLFGERRSVKLWGSWRRPEPSRWRSLFGRMYHTMVVWMMIRPCTVVRCRLK